MTALYGEAALGVWHSVTPEMQRRVETWYNSEHHRERVEIEGFLRARRYHNRGPKDQGGPSFFSRYDAREVAVLGSEAYLHALGNPSPQSAEIFPHYRNTVRGAFRVVARAGLPDGGELLSLRFHDREAEADALEARLRDLVQPLVETAEGVVRAELWRIDVAISTIRTQEKSLRAQAEVYPTLALLIDLTSEERARDCLKQVLPADLVAMARVDRMRLVFSLCET